MLLLSLTASCSILSLGALPLSLCLRPLLLLLLSCCDGGREGILVVEDGGHGPGLAWRGGVAIVLRGVYCEIADPLNRSQ